MKGPTSAGRVNLGDRPFHAAGASDSSETATTGASVESLCLFGVIRRKKGPYIEVNDVGQIETVK
jgi:hypothetical protein